MKEYNMEEYTKRINDSVDMRSTIEDIADIVVEKGIKNIFLVGVGGSYSIMYPIATFAKTVDFPVYHEQAAELMEVGNVNLGEGSLVITLSKSGDTKEIVRVAKYAKDQGADVVAFVLSKDSPIGSEVTYPIELKSVRGVEFEYLAVYMLYFALMDKLGLIDNYEELTKQYEGLRQGLLETKTDHNDYANEVANRHKNDEYMMWIGSGDMWGETYLMSMCILEECQWMKTKSVTSPEFFHGSLELVEKETPVFLVMGEGPTRPLDERVEKFITEYSDNTEVIDSKRFKMEGIDEKYRSLFAPLFMGSFLVERLAAHFEEARDHNLDLRRYYRQFDY